MTNPQQIHWAMALIAAVTFTVATPSTLFSQDAPPFIGCPDCVERYACMGGNDFGFHSCAVEVGKECEGIGICIYVGGDDADLPSRMSPLGLESRASVTVETPEWGAVPAIQVGDGRYAIWSCKGIAIALFEADAFGTLRRLPADSSERALYRLPAL